MSLRGELKKSLEGRSVKELILVSRHYQQALSDRDKATAELNEALEDNKRLSGQREVGLAGLLVWSLVLASIKTWLC